MTAWPPAERAYIVLRPPDGQAELAIGPADVQVADERSRRLHPRAAAPAVSQPVAGSQPVAALRAVYAVGSPPAGLDRIEAVELVGQLGQVLDGVRWSGSDAAAVEHACATAGLPLEWCPAGPAQRVVPQRDVLLRRPQLGDPRFPEEFDPRMALALGRQQVSVVDAAGRRTNWPRLGYAPADIPVVARLRLYQYVEEPWLSFLSSKPNKVHVRHIALLGLDERVLCLLVWSGEQREVLGQAAAAVGLPVEHRSEHANPDRLARQGIPVLKSAQDAAPMRWRLKASLGAFLVLVVAGLAVGFYLSVR
jgi:hypothetical protein